MAENRLIKLIAGIAAAGLLVLGAAPALGSPGGEHGEAHAHDPSQTFNWTTIDYKDKDVHGGTLEEGETPMSPPMILMLMNFAIVLIIIGWKVAPPVRKFVRKRHDSIREALDEATRLREQAKAKLDELTAKVEQAKAEADALTEEMRASAEAEKQRIIADAKAQAEAMKADAEKRIAAELARARHEIEREVVVAAVAAAEALIREKTTSSDQQGLIDTFIRDMQEQVDGASTEERA